MDIPPWISVAITLATPIALGAWHVLAHFTKRHDDVDQRREALADREEERLNQQRDAWVSNIRADLDRSRGLLNDCETDRQSAALRRVCQPRVWCPCPDRAVG
jgi:hypothetical protein